MVKTLKSFILLIAILSMSINSMKIKNNIFINKIKKTNFSSVIKKFPNTDLRYEKNVTFHPHAKTPVKTPNFLNNWYENIFQRWKIPWNLRMPKSNKIVLKRAQGNYGGKIMEPEGALGRIYAGPIIDANVSAIPKKFDKNKRMSFAQVKFNYEQQKHMSSYWKLFVGGLAALFLGKTAYSEFLDFALDGETAATMSDEEFVQFLHRNGCTVSASVKAQVDKETQTAWKQIIELSHLNAAEQTLLQNILQIKTMITGHYDDNNITFEGEFHPYIMQIIKDACKKADIPFKFVVTYEKLGGSADLKDNLAGVYFSDNTQLNFDWNSTGMVSVNKFQTTIFLYLNPMYWGKNLAPLCNTCLAQKCRCLDAQSIIAHEVIHLLQMHSLDDILLRLYLNHVHRVDNVTFEDCIKILTTLHEYQADILPLSDIDCARAHQHRSYDVRDQEENPSPVHVPGKKLYQLASRAVRLHEIEQKILQKASGHIKKSTENE